MAEGLSRGIVATQEAVRALLDWYRAVGVDDALADEPVDRFEESRREAESRKARAAAPPPPAAAARLPAPAAPAPAVRPAPPPPEPRVTRPAGPPATVPLPPERPRFEPQPQPVAKPAVKAGIPGDQAVMAAREAARSARSLDELRDILAGFEGCNLRLTARRLVFADGNPQGRLMFVGEAPGREEDEQGLPFVGRSGQLLDRMLKAIGLDRSGAYIANVVPWRPPGNRTPTPQETEICKPFILRQIELADPDVLVFLGGASASAIVGTTEGILKLRGKWLTHRTGQREIRALATLHPAYLLRQPLQKRLAWRDFLALKEALDGKP
ncbi:uracil-DNA glycosylase [Prosthecomicrobium sp. N25]|uniref:uracil-DNA glycosylase n=1 Tax=Prosthecomicrobium sp. N25 TaxID=3129254 RepID=UPI0030783768